MLRLFVFFSFIAPYALAQDGYPSSCNPAVPNECSRISSAYAALNRAPFPKDTARAKMLIERGIEGAWDGCRAGNSEHCEGLVNLVFHDLADQSDQTKLSALQLANKQTDAACATGEIAACIYNSRMPPYKSDMWPFFTDMEFYDRNKDAIAAIKSKDTYIADTPSMRVRKLAQTRVKAISPACNAGDESACQEMGSIFWMSQDPDTPFDQQQLVLVALRGCVAGGRKACRNVVKFTNKYAIGKNPDEATRKLVADAKTALIQSCNTANAFACEALIHLTTDVKKRIGFMEQACAQNLAESCYRRGSFEYGAYKDDNDPDTLQKAILYLDQACVQKYNMACHLLEHIGEG